MSNINRNSIFSGVSGPYMRSRSRDPFSGRECVAVAGPYMSSTVWDPSSGRECVAVTSPYMRSNVWDPFSGMEFVAATPTLHHLTMSDGTRFDTRIERKDTPEAHVYKINLPGFSKNDIRVKVEGNMLCIRGEKQVEKEESTDMGYCVERSSGMFSKGFELPPDVRVDKIKTCFENEVLTVTAPKDAKRSARIIQIH